MTRWAWVLMIVAALLAPASEAGAQGFNSPYDDAKAKPPKASDGFAPRKETGGRATRATAAPALGIARSDAYSIGPQDVLEISVFGVPELSGQVVVSDSGNIQLPLLGETRAAGRTAEQLQEDLTSRLGAEYLQNPQVRVTVKEFNSRAVTVSGQIGKPGIYPLKGDTTLLQVIAMAGGFQEASDSTVLVLRNRGGKRMAARFDVSAIEKGRVEDPFVQPGDTLVAGESAVKKTFQTFLKALPIAGTFMLF
jgi:polysaccharide export outer membrane protein